jgi:hypothetical protein
MSEIRYQGKQHQKSPSFSRRRRNFPFRWVFIRGKHFELPREHQVKQRKRNLRMDAAAPIDGCVCTILDLSDRIDVSRVRHSKLLYNVSIFDDTMNASGEQYFHAQKVMKLGSHQIAGNPSKPSDKARNSRAQRRRAFEIWAAHYDG